MLRIGILYIGVFISAIAGLIFGDQAIRLMMAVALLAVAVPLWKSLRQQISTDTRTTHWNLIHSYLSSVEPDQEPPSADEQTNR